MAEDQGWDHGGRASLNQRARFTFRWKGGLWLAVLAAALLAAVPATAQEEGGQRPPRLIDTVPRNSLVIGSELGFMSDATALVLPVSARVLLSPELVLQVDVPFGYLDRAGEIADPMVGNLGVGIVGSTLSRLGRGSLRWGLAVTGRAPTSPAIEDGDKAERLARLRSVTPQATGRWSPGIGSLRADVVASYGSESFGAQLQLGALAALPMDEAPATVHVVYGGMMGHRLVQVLWGQVEVTGAQPAPGARDIRGGHYVIATLGLRMLMMRVSPLLFVSFPLSGDVEGDRPVVVGVEIASW